MKGKITFLKGKNPVVKTNTKAPVVLSTKALETIQEGESIQCRAKRIQQKTGKQNSESTH